MRGVWRQLGRAPGFAITTISSLALAVGANAAIFSVVNALWLQPLPVSDPGRIVVPYYPVVHSSDGELLDNVQLPAARALQELGAFESITYELNAATRLGDWRPVLRTAPAAPPIATLAVAANYFDVLGVPIAGRTFSDEEDSRGSDPVAIVSQRLWRLTAGDRPFAAGASVSTNSGAIPVIGVAAPGFHGPRLGDSVDLWITMGALGRLSEMASEPGIERLTPVTVFARLRHDVSVEAAEAEVRTVLNPRSSLRRLRDVAFPLRSEGGLLRQRSLIQTLAVAALLVLVLGCANLAALFTARAVTRRRDLAVRLSLGGTRAHLAGIVACEAAVVGVGGLLVGLLFRSWLLKGIAALETSAGVAVSSLDTGLDWRVFLAALLTVVVAVAITAGGAARQASNTDIAVVVSGHAFGGTGADRRMRQVLLATHAGLAVALLIAATALVATVARAVSSPDAFARKDLIVASVRPRFMQYLTLANESERRLQDYEAVLSRLAALPSARAVSHGDPPFRIRVATEPTPIRVDGRTIQTPLLRVEGGPGYIAAMGTRILEGTDFSARDISDSVHPREMMRFIALRRLPQFREPMPRGGRASAIIDQTLAALLWPNESAVGRSFVWTPFEITYTVVGVSAAFGRHPRSAAAIPAMVAPQRLSSLDAIQPLRLVMSVSDGRAIVPVVANTLRNAFPDAPVLEVNTASGLLAIEMAQERMGARIFSYYAIAAVLLGIAGVYGLVTFLVRQSQREFAVRYALGASERSLALMTLTRVLVPVVAGAIVGAGLSQAFGTALAAKVVGLGSTPVWMSLAGAIAFCGLSAAFAVAAWNRMNHVPAADLLKSA
jgi:putative ABC transport system permease protein